MEKIVFTDWYTVIIGNDSEIAVTKFLKELEKKIESKNYNVFYDDKKFIITYNGIDYNVILPFESEKSLQSTEYTSLTMTLLFLASREKKINSERELQEVRKVKIEAIDDSSYENIESLEDYELYLEYLKKRINSAKTKEERNAINVKIASIIRIISDKKESEKQKIQNPLDLQMHIYRFIYNLLDKVKLLDLSNRKKIIQELKEILNDFHNRVKKYYERKDNDLIIGNPMVPMDILDRIVNLEFIVKQELEECKRNNIVNSEITKIEDELDDIINDNKGDNK